MVFKCKICVATKCTIHEHILLLRRFKRCILCYYVIYIDKVFSTLFVKWFLKDNYCTLTWFA